MMRSLPPALAPLGRYKQFILWKPVPSTVRPDKIDKRPVHPETGTVHNPHDPAIWVDADTAIAKASSGLFGVGFVFTKNDPFFFLDIDAALGADGQWSELAVSLCKAFNGAAVEISQSGEGLHIFGSGTYPPHSYVNKPHGLEFYTERRFVALTGTSAQGSADLIIQPSINWLIENYFPVNTAVDAAYWTDEPAADWIGPEDDGVLIKKMLASRSVSAAFGGRASVQDLWAADVDALSAAFPDPERGFDHNSADAALCAHLAFWTGKNCERMDRLFRQSALYRDKWDRPDYCQRTIRFAVSHCKTVYGTPQAAPTPEQTEAAASNGVILKTGYQFMGISQQLDLFRGCVYVQNDHKAFTPDGSLLKPDQFRAVYGGYVFAVDASNDKTTKSAWEAFTESQGARFPKAHNVCFRPGRKPGELIEEESRVLLNTYVPISTPCSSGDPAPFIDLLNRILPVAGDREILLAYMAACVQYPGTKFRWTVLLQGAPGNGKTTMGNCVMFAVGLRYSHLPQAHDLHNKFNDWMYGRLFINIVDIHVPDHKAEVLEILKPLISDDFIGIQGKGTQQATAQNCANFMMSANEKGAIRKHESDRRLCIFYTAQQSAGDIIKSGMGGTYFPKLHTWLKAEGYAIVNNYLREYQIPDELNPATNCHRAPETSSTKEAVIASQGGVEQELTEAIEEGRPGFKNGWISSIALNRLLCDRRDDKRITPHKRRDILQEFGYDYHPGLNGGRVNNPIPFENGKPRLYIKNGHIHSNLKNPAEIVRHYMMAQEYMPSAEMPAAGRG